MDITFQYQDLNNDNFIDNISTLIVEYCTIDYHKITCKSELFKPNQIIRHTSKYYEIREMITKVLK